MKDDSELDEIDPRIVQIIGFATSKAFEDGRNFDGTYSNSPLIAKYAPQVQALLEAEKLKARKEELKNILDITSAGDIGVVGTYKTDLILGSVVKDRLAELEGKK